MTAIGLTLTAAAVAVLTLLPQNPRAEIKASATDPFKIATFAGGCFWCVEADFDKVPGVVKTISGYTGGELQDPSYEQVSSGNTNHLESVQVHYDPDVITYQGLLTAFWRMIDPTDDGGQFVDRGPQYTTAIFYHNETQQQAAERSRDALAASGRYDKPLVTEIRSAGPFYKAEDYHQNFHHKSSIKYAFYRHRSGRDDYLEKTWGEDLKVDYSQYTPEDLPNYSKPDDQTLQAKLSPMQYKVTQEDATEQPFENEYWDEKREGIYVDVVSGEPLFSSTHKFESGTGWPSFTQPLEPELIVEKKDFNLFYPRTEVRSRYGDSHLGHVFEDGPKPTGLRYCINSAALRFIPKEKLEDEGYGRYLALFQ